MFVFLSLPLASEAKSRVKVRMPCSGVWVHSWFGCAYHRTVTVLHIHSSKGAHISMLFAEGVVAGREFIPDSVAAASEPRIHACLAVSEMSARNNGEEGARMHKSLPSSLIHVSVFLVS